MLDAKAESPDSEEETMAPPPPTGGGSRLGVGGGGAGGGQVPSKGAGGGDLAQVSRGSVVTDLADMLDAKANSPDSEEETMAPPPPTVAVKFVRFLTSSSGQSKPLCYDVPSASKLLLLKDLSSEFSMNGNLIQSGTGFDQIALHYKTDHHLSVSTTDINFSDGQKTIRHIWGQESTKHEADGVSVILRDSELDVTLRGVRVVILLHKEGGNVFLWPAVRQQPKHDSLQGILAKTNLQYEELPANKIKISDQEETASSSTAKDYRLPSAPIVACWLVRLQFALQGELSDFTVAQL